jgi:hypothetical protein
MEITSFYQLPIVTPGNLVGKNEGFPAFFLAMKKNILLS